MIKIKQYGDFSKFEDYLEKSRRKSRIQEQAGAIAEACLDELRKTTPRDSGLTAESWDYSIEIVGRKTSITFFNSNIQNGLNIALLLEYGHGTASGTWVEGANYIEPAIREQYLQAVNKTWKELTKL